MKKDALKRASTHYPALKRGNHWFILQEHAIIGQILYCLGIMLKDPVVEGTRA
ncbi:MAG: hypothetical protein ACTSVI_17640 [Promethearchaeota archaeon]